MSGTPRQIEKGAAADSSKVRRWLKKQYNRFLRRNKDEEKPRKRYKGYG